MRSSQPRWQVWVVTEELRVVREVKKTGGQVHQQENSETIAFGESYFIDA